MVIVLQGEEALRFAQNSTPSPTALSEAKGLLLSPTGLGRSEPHQPAQPRAALAVQGNQHRREDSLVLAYRRERAFRGRTV